MVFLCPSIQRLRYYFMLTFTSFSIHYYSLLITSFNTIQSDLVTAFSNTPQINNMKTDYSTMTKTDTKTYWAPQLARPGHKDLYSYTTS